MRPIEQIEADLESVNSQIRPLFNRRDRLTEELRHAKSVAFIQANNVTLEHVELTSGGDAPFFGHLQSFADWLRYNSTKRFCEWNGIIHFRAEVVDGAWAGTDGRLSDLQQLASPT